MKNQAETDSNSTKTQSGWLICSVILSCFFLIPAFLLLNPAVQPGNRAAKAVKHGFIQLDNEEGALLFQSVQLHNGQSIYHYLDKPPYVAGTYTPLFMATVAMVDNFTKPNFSTGRMIVWFSALASARLLMWLIAATTRNPPLAILTGLLFMATWEVYQWIGYFRVDFPAIMLSLAGLLVIVLGHKHWVSLAIGAFLATAALYTKQTMIAVPCACVIALLFRSRKLALHYIGWMLIWGMPPMILLSIKTDGQFLRHTILYNMNTWHMETLVIWSRHVWRMHQWFFLSGLLALPFAISWIIYESVWRIKQFLKPDNPVDSAPVTILAGFWQPVAWYALLSQWNFLGIAKAGSAENYLLEPIAGWAILIALIAGGALRYMLINKTIWKRTVATVLPLALLCLITLHAVAVTAPASFQLRFNPSRNPGQLDFQTATLIETRMRKAQHPYSELAIYHLTTGKPLIIQPFIMSELARQGLWDQSTFIKQVQKAEFDLVVALDDLTKPIATDTYTSEMLKAFQSSYKLDEIIHTPLWNYHILIPKTGNGQV